MEGFCACFRDVVSIHTQFCPIVIVLCCSPQARETVQGWYQCCAQPQQPWEAIWAQKHQKQVVSSLLLAASTRSVRESLSTLPATSASV